MSVVRVADEGGVRTITLDRPERLNALGREMREGLEHAVASTAESDARVVVLRGAGRAFSAGADLKDRDREPADMAWQPRRRASGKWHRLLDDLEALPQPTIAAMHGPVVGGAALLAVSCDLRVAAADVAVSIPELAIGIPLTWGGIPRLVREIGLPRARELVMTGRWMGANEAMAWGFVQRVGELDVEVPALIAELLAMPAAPLGMTKDAMRAYGRSLVSHEAAWADPDLIDAASREAEGQRAAADYLERLRRDR